MAKPVIDERDDDIYFESGGHGDDALSTVIERFLHFSFTRPPAARPNASHEERLRQNFYRLFIFERLSYAYARGVYFWR